MTPHPSNDEVALTRPPARDYVFPEVQPAPDMRQYWEIIWRRRATFLQVFLLVIIVGAVATALARPVFQTRAQLLVPAGSSQLNVIDSNNPIATMLAAANPDAVSTQIQVLQSTPFIKDAEEAAGVKERPGIVRPSVKVSAVKDTSVIQITVNGGDPAEIKRLGEKMISLHLERTDTLQTRNVKTTLQFVREEEQKAAQRLRDATQKLVSFRRERGVVKMNAEQEARAKLYMELQAQVVEARGNVDSTRRQIERLESRIKREPLDLVQVHMKDNPQAGKLADRLNDLRIQRLALLQDFQPDSDPVVALDEQIAAVTEQLKAEPAGVSSATHNPNPRRDQMEKQLTELESMLLKHEEGFNAANAQYQAQRARMGDWAPWEVELDTLQEERDRALAHYTRLSDRRSDLEIRASAPPQMARVIEAPELPNKPISPRPLLNGLVSIILGVLLATGLVFLQEYLDDRVNEPEDVERITGLPSLGHVPLIAGEHPRLATALSTNTPVAEAYRALRSSIGFAALDAPVRRLQVTSASKGEGKSVTSVNLSTAMAIDGKRVILIDADLRRPSLHRLFRASAAPGLSEYLVGRASLDDILRDTDVEGLRIICAGSIPPNPAELLGTVAFDTLIEELEQRADMVVVDTPPCLPVTDPLIVAGRMHGVILVVHANETRKAAVKHVVEQLERARARVLGVVFNRVEARKGGYYYHYYRHDYYAEDGDRRHRSRENGKAKASLPGGPGE